MHQNYSWDMSAGKRNNYYIYAVLIINIDSHGISCRAATEEKK
jgi:hypothetical protein